VRLFVAVELPEPITGALRELMQSMRRDLPGLRWVRPEGIHLTLKFLGEVGDAGVMALRSCLRAALPGSLPAFSVQVAGMGTFPEGVRPKPRVLWIGIVDAAGHLRRLQEMVEDSCAAAGHAREKKAFSPHLTLARVGDGGPPPGLGKAVLDHRATDLGPVPVSGITLFQSILGPQGATYNALERFAL
jgi:2'-5' RNA ligase